MAAVYKPEQLKITPPPGGFQQGGWYQSRQYWGGTLSDPGTIHPQSTQIGAGQAVSPEVIAQTSPANVAYIEQQRQQQQKLNIQPTAQIAPAQPATQPTTTAPTTPGIPASSIFQPQAKPTIDLESLYTKYFESPEIKAQQDVVTQKQAQLSEMDKQFIEAKGKINDNPFLSEATRVGRVAKIEQLYNERTANIRTDIINAQGTVTQTKADAQVRLNIATQQYNIESQEYQQTLTLFSNLLSAGAFMTASAEDIANASIATGIPTSMIQSIITKQKKDAEVKPTITTVDDGTNQYVVAIDPSTGTVLAKNIIATSKPSTTGQVKAGSSEALAGAISDMMPVISGYLNSYGDISPADWNTLLAAWLARGYSREDFIKNFGQYADTNRKDFKSAYGFAKP